MKMKFCEISLRQQNFSISVTKVWPYHVQMDKFHATHKVPPKGAINPLALSTRIPVQNAAYLGKLKWTLHV